MLESPVNRRDNCPTPCSPQPAGSVLYHSSHTQPGQHGSGMRQSRRLLRGSTLAVCLIAGALLSSTAYAGSFTIDFTTGGLAPTAGSFNYDGVTFSAFTVVWDGFTFDFTSQANNPANAFCGTTGAAAAYALLSQGGGCASPLWQGSAFSQGTGGEEFAFGQNLPSVLLDVSLTVPNTRDIYAAGAWTITNTSAVPEPGSLSFLLTGTVVMALMAGKRHFRPRLRRNPAHR
jgi:hypothetical protein